MTNEERSAVVDDVIDNPEKYKRACIEGARRAHPDMTDEQIEAAWGLVEVTLGL